MVKRRYRDVVCKEYSHGTVLMHTIENKLAEKTFIPENIDHWESKMDSYKKVIEEEMESFDKIVNEWKPQP